MQADPSTLTRRDGVRSLILHWTPRTRRGIDRLDSLYEGYCLAADREQRAYTLIQSVIEIAPARSCNGLRIAVAEVGERIIACQEAIETFAGYLAKRTEADADRVLLAPGIVAEYTADFDRMKFRMDEIDTLADECADVAAVFNGDGK